MNRMTDERLKELLAGEGITGVRPYSEVLFCLKAAYEEIEQLTSGFPCPESGTTIDREYLVSKYTADELAVFAMADWLKVERLTEGMKELADKWTTELFDGKAAAIDELQAILDKWENDG